MYCTSVKEVLSRWNLVLSRIKDLVLPFHSVCTVRISLCVNALWYRQMAGLLLFCDSSWATPGGWNIHFILIIPQITPSNLGASPGKIYTYKYFLISLNHDVGVRNWEEWPSRFPQCAPFYSYCLCDQCHLVLWNTKLHLAANYYLNVY